MGLIKFVSRDIELWRRLHTRHFIQQVVCKIVASVGFGMIIADNVPDVNFTTMGIGALVLATLVLCYCEVILIPFKGKNLGVFKPTREIEDVTDQEWKNGGFGRNIKVL